MQKEQLTSDHRVDWDRLIETALTAPGNVGNVYNRFYRYSFLNQMLLMTQGAAEPVATYRRWLTLGRQVKRGSKAYAIIRPVVVKPGDDAEQSDRRVYFKVSNCLFTVSQTEGD